jgi:DegV family protein with EDD domain
VVHIFTDSTADLGKNLADQSGIHTIPLYVYIRDHTYADGVDITIEDLYQSVNETGQLPKTSAPTVIDFQQAFSIAGESIFISLSSSLSATYQNALLAKNTLEQGKVHIVDSLNLSTGIGLLALKAADLRDQGLAAGEIAQRIEGLKPKVRTSFVIETLDYLYKGGRCSAMQSIMGSLLHIRPVIAVRPDGSLGVKSKTRGTRQKAFRAMLDDFTENLPQINLERVFVTHSGCVEDAEYLKGELLKIAPIQQIYITRAGSVIASHCGPATIGILYLVK